MSWFSEIPTVWSFILFVAIVTIASLVGLYVFKQTSLADIRCEDSNTVISIFVGIVSVFFGVMISFLILTVWNGYSEAELNNEREAQAIYNLYQNVSVLPNTVNEQLLIIAYLEYIINIEFPELKAGTIMNVDRGLKILQNLQNSIYAYVPVGEQQTVLYDKSIDLLNEILNLRIARLQNSTEGMNDILWAVGIIDSLLIIIMSWILQCESLLHYGLVAIVAIYIATGLYIIWLLSYPYRGYAGITPLAFEDALQNILSQSPIINR